jgi:hypothetical protein
MPAKGSSNNRKCGSLDGERIGDVLETELGEQLFGANARSPTADRSGLQNGEDVVSRAELREDRPLLREIAEPEARAFVQRAVCDVRVADPDVAAGRLDESGDHRQRNGLAGSVRAEQTNDFAAPHGKINAVDDPSPGVVPSQRFGAQRVALGNRGRENLSHGTQPAPLAERRQSGNA